MTIDFGFGREKTDFSLFVLLSHGTIQWMCDTCEFATHSVYFAALHMRDNHPALLPLAAAGYKKYRM